VTAVLVALYIGVTCAGCGTLQASPALTVEVQSDHWYAKTVRVMCDTYQIGAVRGVELNKTQRKRVALNGCYVVRLRVEAVGGEWWASGGIMVQPGDTLKLRIGPTLALSAFTVRGAMP